MKKNRMSIKIISYILIQAFIALDFCWAGVVASPVDAGTLAPEVALGQADFKALMKIINKKDGSLSALDFGADMNLEDELDSMPDEGELNITTVDNNGSVGSSGSNSNPSLNGNKGNSVNGGDSLIPASSPPPEDLVTYVLVNTEKSIFTVYPSAQDEGEDAMHEITFLEYMKVTGLNEEDIAFVELKVKPIVLKNSNYFQNVQFCSPTVKLQENELQQQARGPFRVKTNSTLQNLIELALAAVTLQNDIKDVVTLMYNALVNLTDDSLEPQRILIKKKEVNVIGILYSMAEYIEKNKTIKLADVYNLATELVGKFEKLGIQFSDIDPNRRKTIGVRPEHVPKLREKFEANPARVELYLRYMMLLHEEGHISLISALAYQLKTIFSETKVKILDAFRALIKEDWPKLFIQLGFMPLSNKDEKRSQADVIIQTLWLLGYHPLRKDLFGVYWTEAIAHYYAYLKIKEQVEYDKLAIEALSLGIHYSLELNPPQLERLGFVLENSVNSFYPFLTSG
ncbi:MAG: hypothetical protein L6416_12570, partial [Candidatus Omnitrophica bacterium]|nr:hypothetical protein [Candidatus Omnitrophota bacterium]